MLTRMRQIKLSEKNQILQGVSEVLVQCQSLVQSLSKFQVIDDGFIFSSSPTTVTSSTMMSNPRAKEESEFYHSVKEEYMSDPSTEEESMSDPSNEGESMSDRSDEEESMSDRSDEESVFVPSLKESVSPMFAVSTERSEVPPAPTAFLEVTSSLAVRPEITRGPPSRRPTTRGSPSRRRT